MNELKAIILFFIPRFVTEDVAIIRTSDYTFDVVCTVDALEDDDYYNDVIHVKAFTWFGVNVWLGDKNGNSKK